VCMCERATYTHITRVSVCVSDSRRWIHEGAARFLLLCLFRFAFAAGGWCERSFPNCQGSRVYVLGRGVAGVPAMFVAISVELAVFAIHCSQRMHTCIHAYTRKLIRSACRIYIFAFDVCIHVHWHAHLRHTHRESHL